MSLVASEEALSVRRQCALLEVSRSRYYYQPQQESEENLALMRLMDERYLTKSSHGVLRMQDYLREQGYSVNQKRVRRLLRKMGLTAIYPKPSLSQLGEAKYIYPYLLRNLSVVRSNQVWEIDITYIPMDKGFMYMVAIIDVYSRFIVGWELTNTLEVEGCLKVFAHAVSRYGAPEIMNSDQGSQFTCERWVDAVKDTKAKLSMDGKGRALDNIYIERFWRSVKYDYVYLNPTSDSLTLYKGLKKHVEECNAEAHQGIGRRKPYLVYLEGRSEFVQVNTKIHKAC